MGAKGSVPGNKVDELREATREANQTLKDLRAVLKQVNADLEGEIFRRFHEFLNRAARTADTELVNKNNELIGNLVTHINKIQKSITEKVAYIGAMSGADDSIIQLIAIDIIKRAGGTIEIDDVKYHLVREEFVKEKDGTIEGGSFSFPKGIRYRIEIDPFYEKAMQKALQEHDPKIANFDWQED